MKTQICFLTFFIAYLNISSQVAVCTKEGYHLIDEDGDTYTKHPHTFIDNSNKSVFLAYSGSNFIYLNAYGEKIHNGRYQVAYPYNGSFALVGLNGKFHHINLKGQVMDTLGWPKAPEVYQRNFLISKSRHQVIYKDSSIALFYPDTAVLGTRNGIFLWDRMTRKAQQYIASRSSSKLTPAKEFNDVVSLIRTQEGYAIVLHKVGDSTLFSMTDNQGRYLVKDHPDIRYYPTMRVIHDRYVALGVDDIPYKHWTPWSLEHWWKASDLVSDKERKPRSPIYISNDHYSQELGILLTEEPKWLFYRSDRVFGDYLFDEALPSDERNFPVKMGLKWYLWNARKEAPMPLKVQEVNPLGIENGFMLVSQTRGEHADKKWALMRVKDTSILTEEIYSVPPLDRSRVSLYKNRSQKIWYDDILLLEKDGLTVAINEEGKEIHTEPTNAPSFQLKDFYECDFVMKMSEFADIPKGSKFDKKNLSVQIAEVNGGLQIIVANQSKEMRQIEIQDGQYQFKLQFETGPEKWKTIAYLPGSTCGNSYYKVDFPAGKMTKSRVALPPGSYRYKVRLVLETGNVEPIYSNELRYPLPVGLTWVSKYYPPYGAVSKLQVSLKNRR